MADDKPKHKPQKKRTLEEVLKSLQDLIRSDLVSARTASGTPVNAADRTSATPASADEPESFHDALHKLDEIITEKIIEPVERANEVPPEPLLPDEELEITWIEPAEPVAPLEPAETADASEILADEILIEAVDSITLETAPTPPQEEIEAESPPEKPPASEIPAESPEQAPPEQPPYLNVDETVVLEAVAEPAIEPASTTEAESPGTVPAEPSAPEPTQEAAEPDGQSMFDFELPPLAEATGSPSPASQLEAGPPAAAPSQPEVEPKTPTAPEDDVDRDAAAPDHERDALPNLPQPEPERNKPEEQSGAAAVEFEKRETDDFTVEFTVEPIKPAHADSTAPQSQRGTASPSARESRADVASHLTEQSSVNENPDTPPSTGRTSPGRPAQPESPGAPSGPEPAATDSAPPSGEIPVLKEVADVETPPSPPLPDASQARDIAIRVIAKLNIERRKAGETPLDIKTIDRLQQYLADALTKRALNKPKK